ncbi:MAG: 1,4-alpha-glucan branching protein GlgB [Dehalococcoidia bacterium]|nr:1,4-alpha-glucan branching protein GlgB [Dehalococcoidia bacterium]
MTPAEKHKKEGLPGFSLLTEDDLYLFNEGSHFRLYDKLGAHVVSHGGQTGVYFAVWAPNARSVSVIGSFNEWKPGRNRLSQRGRSGVWEGFIPGIGKSTRYKYHIVARDHGYHTDRADPLAFYGETPPHTASTVWELDYDWNDKAWMESRKKRSALDQPVAIYEMHLGSWKRVEDDSNRSLTYRELAEQLPEYVSQAGFTHVELMPVMEHPFYGSWGYQTTGYFSPTSRYGTPQDLMHLIDCFHRKNIAVILDWVPSHFPDDKYALSFFDGTYLYEHADPRKGIHPDWKSAIFNYGRNEVWSFLISSALFWLDKYHADGLRLDAVASMLYLDYSRKNGDWIPNKHGGPENLEAIDFIQRLNQEVYRSFPDVQTIAEESTSWSMVSRPTYVGGLGFGMKWDMGWMHDTLKYMSLDTVHRKYHHNQLSFRMLYAFHENFVLPLSHDEVVYGKCSLLNKMPGDYWQKFANLRLLYGYMYGQSGKKLLFMGGEFGQWDEWQHEAQLDWRLLGFDSHRQLKHWVTDLNRVYRHEKALHEQDCNPAGFEWIDCNDSDHSVISFLRKGKAKDDVVTIVCNFTPVPRLHYRVGVPQGGCWQELLNSDAREYGGSGMGNLGGLEADHTAFHGRPYSLDLTLPPLSVLFMKPGEK